MKNKVDYSIYLVTDRELMSTPSLEDAVQQAIEGGCTLVQLREKDLDSLSFYNLALSIKDITTKYKVPLIINDRIDIALAIDADGVHIGQSDIPAEIARKLIGPNKILGVSASSVEEALKAFKDGADYLGVGAMFATGTKTDANIVSMEELRAIRDKMSIPIVVIGGINKTTMPYFDTINIDGVSVVSAIIAEPNIKKATEELRELFYKNRS